LPIDCGGGKGKGANFVAPSPKNDSHLIGKEGGGRRFCFKKTFFPVGVEGIRKCLGEVEKINSWDHTEPGKKKRKRGLGAPWEENICGKCKNFPCGGKGSTSPRTALKNRGKSFSITRGRKREGEKEVKSRTRPSNGKPLIRRKGERRGGESVLGGGKGEHHPGCKKKNRFGGGSRFHRETPHPTSFSQADS